MFPILVTAILLLLILCKLAKRKNRRLNPPGPRPWPIIGNLLQMAFESTDVMQMFSNFAKKYGEIYSLKVGLTPTVILSSPEAIRTVLADDAALGREKSGMFRDRLFGMNIGIAGSEGEMWLKNKIWTFKQLRKSGFGNNSVAESYMHESAAHITRLIDEEISEKNEGASINMDGFFFSETSRFTWRQIVGRLTIEDEKDIDILTKKGRTFIRSGTLGAGLITAFPFFRFMFPVLTGHNIHLDFFNTCNSLSQKLLSETKSNLKKENFQSRNESLLKAFALNMNEDPTIFFLENFQLIFQDIFLGGTETTSTYMESIFLYLILYPDVQERIYQEIRTILKNRKQLCLADRSKMIYTQAFTLEVHRCAPVAPNYLPRRATKDLYYKGYLIKKDTLIIGHILPIHNDPGIWEDPENFRPERFINDNGELYRTNRIMPFGYGKRVCPGEMQTNSLAFIILTSLLQKYSICTPPGNLKPTRELLLGFTFKPKPFSVCFKLRPLFPQTKQSLRI